MVGAAISVSGTRVLHFELINFYQNTAYKKSMLYT